MRRAGDDRGAVLPVVALSLVVLMIMTAFSVDIGRQILRRRQAQAAADLIALDLGRQIDGRTTCAIQSDPKWGQTLTDAADRNDFPSSGVTAVLGRWDDAARTFTPTSCAEAPTSVQVNAADDVDFFFARVIGISSGHVSRDGVASIVGPTNCTSLCNQERGSHAWGWLGSVVAGFQYYNDPSVTSQYNLAADLRAKVMNSVLYKQLGMSNSGPVANPPTGVGLDAVGYKGLANGYFTLGDLATAAGFGSVNDLVAANMKARDLVDAMVTALNAQGTVADANAATILGSFAPNVSNSATVALGDFMSVNQGNSSNAADYAVNALQLLSAAGEMIDGKNFFSTTIATTIFGVTSLPIKVAIIEGPQMWDNVAGNGPCTLDNLEAGCGPRTAQVRVSTSIPVTLDLTPFGVPLVQATNIPIVLEAASAQSYFSAINCADPTANSSTAYRVVSNGVAMSIGSVTDSALQADTALPVQPQPLLHGSLTLGVPPAISLDSITSVAVEKTFKNGAVYSGDIESNANVAGTDETHTFVGDDILAGAMSPTSWRYAGGVNGNVSNTVFQNLGISNVALNSALNQALQTSLADLDTKLVDPILSSLGVAIAGADGAVTKVGCTVRLVD
jgi:uncharacterized membrane protein